MWGHHALQRAAPPPSSRGLICQTKWKHLWGCAVHVRLHLTSFNWVHSIFCTGLTCSVMCSSWNWGLPLIKVVYCLIMSGKLGFPAGNLKSIEKHWQGKTQQNKLTKSMEQYSMHLCFVALIHVENMRHIVYLILTLYLLVIKKAQPQSKYTLGRNCSAAPALAGLLKLSVYNSYDGATRQTGQEDWGLLLQG